MDADLHNWSDLLVQHRNWLATVVYARLRDREAVEEVLQETALAAARGGLPLTEPDRSRWLYRVAVRQAVLYRRGQARYGRRLRQSRERTVSAAPPPNPWRLVIATEQEQLVRRALEHLGAGDCEVLMLKYTESWSCREIAMRLGVSESAIKSRLLRARRMLRSELLKLAGEWELP
jgi:RNA polymerase sigma-70 factor (ECF subfamily)